MSNHDGLVSEFLNTQSLSEDISLWVVTAWYRNMKQILSAFISHKENIFDNYGKYSTEYFSKN